MMSKRKLAKWSVVVSLLVLGFALAGCQSMPTGDITKKYYYTTTEDKMTLALRRYKPAHLSGDKCPVILCHGLSYNLMFWDIGKEVSLVNYLVEAGYDVWLLSLRGAAPSSQPANSALRKLGRFNLDPEMLNAFKQRLSDLKMTDWSVDDHIKYDIPAALKFVKEQTGYKRVHWIGHSMGGMIMFGYLSQGVGADEVKSFVAVSTPMAVFHPLSEPFKLLVNNEAAFGVGSAVVGSSAPASLGAIFGDMGTPMDKLFFNGQNVDAAVLKALFYLVEEEISPSQLKQLLGMVRTERFKSLDGKIDYTGALSQVTTPTYFMVGTVDNMATVGAVQYAYRQVSSADKEYRLFGRVNSNKDDYGHCDIIIGRYAREEVYPTIAQWLNGHPYDPAEERLMLQPGAAEGDAAKKEATQNEK
jgi:pimeloyl-ACP methyl ester carboxylesterase